MPATTMRMTTTRETIEIRHRETGAVLFATWLRLRHAVVVAVHRGVDLGGADLRGVSLPGAILGGARLVGADLRYADLTRADLRYANLRDADLTGAKLTGARVDGAKWDGAKLDCPIGYAGAIVEEKPPGR